MTSELLGSDTTRIEDAPDGDGIDIPIPEDIVDILGLEDGDDVAVTITQEPDGTLTITGELTDTDLTPEQRDALRSALEQPADSGAD